MKRALALFASLGVAVIALLFTAQPAHTQGTLGPAPLVNVTTGGGLTKTGQKVGMLSTCGTNEILKWSGSAWACAADSGGGLSDGDKGDVTVTSSGTVWNIDANTVTGTELAITPTNCGGGGSSFITDIDADGNGTCTTETGDVSGVTANSPLSGGGSSGAITVGMANGDRGDITTTTGTQTGDTWTIDPLAVDNGKIANSTIASAKLNITTTSCSAGQHVSAISAGGVGTCTADTNPISSLTTNRVTKATSATAIGNSQIVDDGTDVILASATTGAYTHAGEHSFNFGYYDGGTASGVINYRGCSGGFGCLRNLIIADGQANTIATFTGSTKAVALAGTLDVTGALTFNAASNVGNELTLSGTFSSNGTSTTLSNGTGDQVTIGGGELRDTGAAPSSFTCGTGASASGGRNWFRVTVGTSPSATCAITFSTAFGSTPTCSVTRGNSTARADSYVSAISTGSMTISNDTGTTLTAGAIFHVNCGG